MKRGKTIELIWGFLVVFLLFTAFMFCFWLLVFMYL